MGRRWTEEETQHMLDVLRDGGSYDDAARAVGRPRNAIAGKFDRLIRAGDDRAILASRAVGKNRQMRWERARRRRADMAAKKRLIREAKARAKKKKEKKQAPKPMKEYPKLEVKAEGPEALPAKEPPRETSFLMEVIDSGGVGFADLKSRSCRYIISGEERPTRYCGEKTESDSVPWCARHAARVHVRKGESR